MKRLKDYYRLCYMKVCHKNMTNRGKLIFINKDENE